ncbi:hypothetical protein [Desulfovibrio litoralis]|uniref:Uncharacterized protein n=1 Tax=Desulfovibrio litoralis DSM 11393 TaxID=1121455 RepID=A0A1M7RRK5_9BACT|nr:hypothetical protein [Desulfovibrio litoralis]SHN48752.1 hypothetical protein SAMN02745728_00040 [Desulfovibrio litoralis DSM 11393]
MELLLLENQLNDAKNLLEKVMVVNKKNVHIKYVYTGILHILENIDTFGKSLKASKPFITYFKENITSLSQMEQQLSKKQIPSYLEHINEVCFSLFEEMVIFFRERDLNPNVQTGTFETSFLSYFKNHDDWLPTDETLVCRFYYDYLPRFFNSELNIQDFDTIIKKQ